MRQADGEAQYGLFVEQAIDDARRTEALVELGGDIIDVALWPDILARDDHLRMRQHQVGDRPGPQPRPMLGLLHAARTAADTRGPIVGGWVVGGAGTIEG